MPLHEIFSATTETLVCGRYSVSKLSAVAWWPPETFPFFSSWNVHSCPLPPSQLQVVFLYFWWGGAGKHGTECSLELCCKGAKRRVLCFSNLGVRWMAGVWEVMVLILLLKSCGKRNNSRSKKKRWGQVQGILCRIPKRCVLIFSRIFRSLYVGFVF